jgi:hypothetical protein
MLPHLLATRSCRASVSSGHSSERRRECSLCSQWADRTDDCSAHLGNFDEVMRQGIGAVGEKWETRRQLVAVNEKLVEN